MERTVPPGWYPDPTRVGCARYWDGGGWTATVAWGGRVTQDDTPLHDVARVQAEHDIEVIDRYLADVEESGLLDHPTAERIHADLLERRRLAGAAVSARAVPTATRQAVARPGAEVEWPAPTRPIPVGPSRADRGPGAGGPAMARPALPAPTPLQREAGAVARWWAGAREALAGDLALHGLAYLGVLLLFAGVFGLIAFSFDEVRSDLRVWAEILVPVSFFVSGWYLKRRGAVVVASALTLLGGVLLPVVAMASVTDGAGVPPDATGRALPVVQALICVVVASGMALVVRRNPQSPLRFLVAPVLWLGAGVAAGLTNEVIPTGADVIRVTPIQLSVMLVSVAVTVLVLRRRSRAGALSAATFQVAPYVAGAVYVLELVVAGTSGWATGSGLLAAGSMMVLLELLADRFPPEGVTIAQVVVIGAAGLRFVPGAFQPAWVAVAVTVVLVVLAEWTGRRRPTLVGSMAVLLGIGGALLLTIDEPPAAVAAFGLTTVWALVRRVAPPAWAPAPDRYGLVPAALSTVVALELARVTDTGVTLVACSGVIFSIAVAGRLVPALRADLLWRWWVPTAAAVVSVVSFGLPWAREPGSVAVVAALAAVAMALSAVPLGARTWLTVAAACWSLANVAEFASVPLATQAVVLAGLAVVLVVIGVTNGRPIAVQLGLIGHVAGLAAMAIPIGRGWVLSIVVALATAGWLVAAVMNERHEVGYLSWVKSVVGEFGVQGDAWIDSIAPLAVLGGTSIVTVLMLDASGRTGLADPWSAAATAAVAAAAAVIVRLVPWRRADARVLSFAVFGLATSAVIITLTRDLLSMPGWATIVALTCGIAVVVIHPPPRPALYGWVGWAESAGLTVAVAHQAGLDRHWFDLAFAAWGSVVLVGAVLRHRIRHGPRPRGILDETSTSEPLVLGAVALLVGGGLTFVDATQTVAGWLCLAYAVPVLIVAVLLSLGCIGGIAEVLVSAAFVLLAPWSPWEHPWSIVPWAGGLLVLAWLVRPRAPIGPLVRWDLSTFVVAHAMAVLALLATSAHGSVPVTFVAVACLSAATGLVIRRWEWIVAGAALALLGAASAGPGWLALALGLEGLASTARGLKLEWGRTRWTMLVLGSVMITLAWVSFTEWQAWSILVLMQSTGFGAALLALVVAWAVRRGTRPRDLWLVWLVDASVTAMLACGLGFAPDVGRHAGGLTVAGVLSVLAVSAAVCAAAVQPALRWVAVLLLGGASIAAYVALEPSPWVVVAVGTTVALVVGVELLLLHVASPTSPWIGPALALCAFAQLGPVLVALGELPRRDLLIVVLLALAAESAVGGAVLRATPLVVAAPILACVAWLVYAGDSLTNAHWFTIPIGLTILVDVGLIRWLRRARGEAVATADLVVLELVGMFFTVGASLAQVLSGHLWYALPAIGVGIILGAWGILTRVRRRAAFGAGVIVVSVLLLLGVPLASAIPTWTGPALWLAVAAIGVAAIVVATLLEQGRSVVRKAATRLDELTTGWE